jgi:hypothetical protein
MLYIAILLIVIAVIIILSISSEKSVKEVRGEDVEDHEWKYGDVWKQGSPDDAVSDQGVLYVEIIRGDTGKGYDDSYMMGLVSYLGSKGIRATFDSFSLGIEPAAIKTYVLKVEAGKEDEAKGYLKEKGL